MRRVVGVWIANDVAWALMTTMAATGMQVRVIGPTARGESGSTFEVLVGDAKAVLKVLTDGPGVVENQQRLVRLIGVLREGGYPAPEYLLAVGTADDVVFTIQRRMPGQTLEPGPGRPVDPVVLASTLPSILEAVELQAGAGDLAAFAVARVAARHDHIGGRRLLPPQHDEASV